MNELERQFLARLADMRQGRCSYDLVRRDGAMEIAGRLLDGGFIRERRLGYSPGFQITEKGREYLGGQA